MNYRGVEGDAALALVDSVGGLGDANPGEVGAEELHWRGEHRLGFGGSREDEMKETRARVCFLAYRGEGEGEDSVFASCGEVF